MIYLWEAERESLVEDIRSYSEQIQKRLFESFRDIEDEAKEESDRFLAEYGLNLGEDGDPAAAQDGAYDVYVDYQLRMYELIRELYLTAASGLFFMWDRQVRTYFERELIYYLRREDRGALIWSGNVFDLFERLTVFDIDVGNCCDYKKLRKLSLIVNVHKHGKGPSLDLLVEEYGDEFQNFWGSDVDVQFLNEKSIFISEEEFFEFRDAMIDFWRRFPNQQA